MTEQPVAQQPKRQQQGFPGIAPQQQAPQQFLWGPNMVGGQLRSDAGAMIQQQQQQADPMLALAQPMQQAAQLAMLSAFLQNYRDRIATGLVDGGYLA